MVRFRVRFWAAWKELVALGVDPGLHHLHRGGRDGLPGGLGGLDLHLGGRQGPRRQDEIRHKTAGLAGGDFRLLARRLDVLAVHQHLHFHFLEALAHGVGDQPGDRQAVPGRRLRCPHRRRTGKNHQENCQEYGHCQVSVHLHNYFSLSLYFLNWLIKDKGLPG